MHVSGPPFAPLSDVDSELLQLLRDLARLLRRLLLVSRYRAMALTGTLRPRPDSSIRNSLLPALTPDQAGLCSR